jgi:NDP-sugar pyrophosphorylase family protein
MAIRSAVILAGGGGRRMWPFAAVRNKCALPVCNVPNVRRIADSLAEVGVQRIVVVTGRESGSVRHALYRADCDIAFVEQAPEAGTAGAALAAFESLDDDQCLVIYGDTVTTTENFRAVADVLAERNVAGAVLWDDIPSSEGSLWHGLSLEADRVEGVIGHEAESAKRFCGVLALDRSIVPHLAANPGRMQRVPVGGMPPAEPDLAQSLNDWIERDRIEVVGVRARDFVVDLDKPWHILEANRRALDHACATLTENRIDPTARIHDGAEIDGFVELGPGAEIGNRVVVSGGLFVGRDSRVVNGAIVQGNAMVGGDCRVRDYCILGGGTVVGNRCVVGHGAEMDGVLFDGAYLWHYCEISGVVGQNVDVGAATVCGTLRFDDAPAEHRIGGRRERPARGANETYIGDFSRTGVNVITMPGAKIGAYSCVGAGIVVYEDVPDNTLRILKQETVNRPWGPERYGW